MLRTNPPEEFALSLSGVPCGIKRALKSFETQILAPYFEPQHESYYQHAILGILELWKDEPSCLKLIGEMTAYMKSHPNPFTEMKQMIAETFADTYPEKDLEVELEKHEVDPKILNLVHSITHMEKKALDNLKEEHGIHPFLFNSFLESFENYQVELTLMLMTFKEGHMETLKKLIARLAHYMKDKKNPLKHLISMPLERFRLEYPKGPVVGEILPEEDCDEYYSSEEEEQEKEKEDLTTKKAAKAHQGRKLDAKLSCVSSTDTLSGGKKLNKRKPPARKRSVTPALRTSPRRKAKAEAKNKKKQVNKNASSSKKTRSKEKSSK
jgi:hypothetical protein